MKRLSTVSAKNMSLKDAAGYLDRIDLGQENLIEILQKSVRSWMDANSKRYRFVDRDNIDSKIRNVIWATKASDLDVVVSLKKMNYDKEAIKFILLDAGPKAKESLVDPKATKAITNIEKLMSQMAKYMGQVKNEPEADWSKMRVMADKLISQVGLLTSLTNKE